MFPLLQKESIKRSRVDPTRDLCRQSFSYYRGGIRSNVRSNGLLDYIWLYVVPAFLYRFQVVQSRAFYDRTFRGKSGTMAGAVPAFFIIIPFKLAA